MKKGGVVFILVIISILIISFVSFVSAGLLGDVWNKITGKVIENETEVEECPASISISFNKNVYYEGDLFKITVEVFDSQGNRIPNVPFYISTYLYSEDRWGSPSGSETTNEQGYHEHSDSGLKIVETGKFLYKFYTQETESCSSVEDTAEIEFIKEEIEEEAGSGPEAGPEIPPETCAARIKVTFDKEVYYIGDEFKAVMEVFDSQGNNIPYYHFYFQTYTYEPEGMWHTPSAETTDGNGDRIYEGVIERGKMTLGRTKHKVYVEAHDNCPYVEDTIELEVKENEIEPVPCGIGTCIPEEVEEVEAIPEEKIFYKCNGCELGDKCYPIGYRKEGQYCSDNYEFISQIDDNCENSFECKSNVCISSECVEEGLIKKIIKWFKKLFGIEPEPEEPGLEMCSKLLIEKDIEDYEYVESAYGHKDHQVALYSEDGQQIGIVKCCIAVYENPDGTGGAGIVCPFDNRKDLENSFYWLANKEDIILGENYKGQKVYRGSEPEPEVIVWTSNTYIIATGGGPSEVQLAEDVADAYFDKYPNDLGEIVGVAEPFPVDEEGYYWGKSVLCENYNGTWSEEYKECSGISEETCENIGGAFDSCASSCRHSDSFVGGDVIVGFFNNTIEDQADNLIKYYNLSWESHFPKMFSLKIKTLIGFPEDYIEDLEKEDIVLWADNRGGSLLVQFNIKATNETAYELINSFNNLEILSGNYGQKWGVVKVPEGEEENWMETLEDESIVEYAELNGISCAAVCVPICTFSYQKK